MSNFEEKITNPSEQSFLIIGGSSDIGLHLGELILGSGRKLTVLARDIDRLTKIKTLGGDIIEGDGLDSKSVEKAIDVKNNSEIQVRDVKKDGDFKYQVFARSTLFFLLSFLFFKQFNLFVIFKILSGFIPITEYLPLKSPSFNDSKRKLFSISSDIFMKLLTGSTKSELNFRIIN